MKLFQVLLITNHNLWSFSPKIVNGDWHDFPADFHAFDRDGPNAWPNLVWITDNLQAMVAYDYLLENGWTLDTDTAEPQRLAFLNLLNATADK